jgi:hypothetical protein
MIELKSYDPKSARSAPGRTIELSTGRQSLFELGISCKSINPDCASTDASGGGSFAEANSLQTSLYQSNGTIQRKISHEARYVAERMEF